MRQKLIFVALFWGLIATTVAQALDMRGSGSLNSSKINNAYLGQTLFSDRGTPLVLINGLTYGVENTASTHTIPGGTFGAWDGMRCHASGRVQNNSGGSQSLVLRWYYGNAVMNSNVIALTSAAAYRNWQMDWDMLMAGATNSEYFDGTAFLGPTASTDGSFGGAVAAMYAGYAQGLSVDSASDQTVHFSLQLGAATGVATTTATPTAGTTPITWIQDVSCYRWPGVTPTPTPTQAPTATPT